MKYFRCIVILLFGFLAGSATAFYCVFKWERYHYIVHPIIGNRYDRLYSSEDLYHIGDTIRATKCIEDDAIILRSFGGEIKPCK
jgi:hypothetical protein